MDLVNGDLGEVELERASSSYPGSVHKKHKATTSGGDVTALEEHSRGG